MKKLMLISVVLSFRNEEENLEQLIDRLRKVFIDLKDYDYQLIFVNDNSTDKSLDILTREGKRHGDLKILNMGRCFGNSECVLAGLQYAKGSAVIYMDADLQDPPELIGKLLAVWREEGSDVVYTTRLSRPGESRLKMFLTKVAYKMLGHFSDVPIPFDSGDFKLLSQRAVGEILRFKEQKPFIRGYVGYLGLKESQVFYHRAPRQYGKTKFPVLGKRNLYNFLDSALISFSDVPLKLIFPSSGIIFLGLFLLLSWMLIQRFQGLSIPASAAIAALMLFLSGTQIFILGIMGLYLNSAFLDVKRRPLYILRNVIDFTPAQDLSFSLNQAQPSDPIVPGEWNN